MKEFLVYYLDDSTSNIQGTEIQLTGNAVTVLNESVVVAILTLSSIQAVIETTSLVEDQEEDQEADQAEDQEEEK